MHTLPIRRGDRVLILGADAALAQSVVARGADPVCLRLGDLKKDGVPLLDRDTFDHGIVLSPGKRGVPERVLSAVRPALRARAGLFFGVSRHRRFSRDRKGWTLAEGVRAFGDAGFSEASVYGVRPSLRSPQILVPLDDPLALRWFVTSMWLPLSAGEALTWPVRSRVRARRAALTLFSDIAFLART